MNNTGFIRTMMVMGAVLAQSALPATTTIAWADDVQYPLPTLPTKEETAAKDQNKEKARTPAQVQEKSTSTEETAAPSSQEQANKIERLLMRRP